MNQFGALSKALFKAKIVISIRSILGMGMIKAFYDDGMSLMDIGGSEWGSINCVYGSTGEPGVVV